MSNDPSTTTEHCHSSERETPGLSWEELAQNPKLDDLPYKIESNGRGQLVMSPTMQYHGSYQFRIGREISNRLDAGEIVVESDVQTSDGNKVADVAWYSDERWDVVRDTLAAPVAPEIVVEVRSPSNTDEELAHKRDLYFEAGAEEAWLCDEEGVLRFFDPDGEIDHSRLVPGFPASVA